ncbi:hypothetical protein CRYUN_Cryun20dG0048500 [Craigia yunnanensis]
MLYANLEIKESCSSSKRPSHRHRRWICEDSPDLCRNNSLNGTMVGEENVMGLLVPLSSQEKMPEGVTAGLHSKSGSMTQSTDFEKHERGSVELKSQQDSISEMDDIEDDTFNPVISRSG